MPYRVIQWSTGAMGKTRLRAVLDPSDMELAGVLTMPVSTPFRASQGRQA